MDDDLVAIKLEQKSAEIIDEEVHTDASALNNTTPAPRLTIGKVLEVLPKKKNGTVL